MTDHSFSFQGQHVQARASGALFWPERRWLILADLHLGKSERLARRGGSLLPPYEVQDTLDRLEAEIALTDPRCVISLGDAFDDDLARHSLSSEACARLRNLARGRSWLWITGNHDPIPPSSGPLPGTGLPELRDGLLFRHQAGAEPDVSGHYHPCLRLAGQRRRCFVIGQDHLILPAFGSYTGGLSVDDPVLRALVPRGLAVACGHRAIPVPLPRKAVAVGFSRRVRS